MTTNNQHFWAIVDAATGKIIRGRSGISGYKIYPTRDEARDMNKLWRREKDGNYAVRKVEVYEAYATTCIHNS